MPLAPIRIARFEGGRLDLNSGELHLEGQTVRLQQQPFRLLVVLVEHPGRVVGRDELRARLWPDDTNVMFDQGIDTSIRKLRSAFRDDPVHPQYIETLPRRGYRWLKTVTWEAPGTPTIGTAEGPSAHAVQLASARGHRLVPPTTRLAGQVESDEAFLLGRRALNQVTPESVTQARAWFEQAIAMNATHAAAYSGLARCWFVSAHFGLGPASDLMPLAKDAALRAVSLDEQDAEAHATLGQIAGAFDFDWQEAMRRYQRVLSCRPVSLMAQQWCAQFILLPLRRFDEAIAMIEPLLIVEPCELFLRKTFGEALAMRGHHARAIEQLRQCLALDQTFWLAHFALGNVYFRNWLIRAA